MAATDIALSHDREPTTASYRALLATGVSWLVVASFAAGWSIYYHLPNGFAGHGSPAQVGRDFITSGTALAPPLIMMVILAGGLALAARRSGWGTLGRILVGLVALVSIIGILGEPTFATGFESGHFDLAQDVQRIPGLGLSLALVLLTGQGFVRQLRHRSTGTANA